MDDGGADRRADRCHRPCRLLLTLRLFGAETYHVVDMAKKTDIPYAHKNHTGWWLYCEVQQWVSNRKTKLSAAQRCPVWENMRLVRAKDREEAYRKAIEFSKSGMPSKTYGGEWRFAGLSSLLPVYEEFEDGSEISWLDRGTMSVKNIKRLVKTKGQLPLFNDQKVNGIPAS
jgi:hypothetical protein